jgi:hypothetical protein
MGNNLQCTTGCCDRTTEMQPDSVDKGDLGMQGASSRSIMKNKKAAPKFEVQDIVPSSEGGKCVC